MKVIIEQTAGKDYPLQMKDNAQFYAKQKATVKRLLDLRSDDIIEIREV